MADKDDYSWYNGTGTKSSTSYGDKFKSMIADTGYKPTVDLSTSKLGGAATPAVVNTPVAGIDTSASVLSPQTSVTELPSSSFSADRGSASYLGGQYTQGGEVMNKNLFGSDTKATYGDVISGGGTYEQAVELGYKGDQAAFDAAQSSEGMSGADMGGLALGVGQLGANLYFGLEGLKNDQRTLDNAEDNTQLLREARDETANFKSNLASTMS